MRITLVVERFEPGAGGVENVAWTVAHALAEAGDEVRVVARRAQSTGALDVRRVNVPRAWQPLRVVAFSRAAARAAPRGSCDAVYSLARTRHQDVYRAGGGSHADYLAHRFEARGRRLRRLSPRHAVLLDTERRVFRDASQTVICGSEMVRDELARRHGLSAARLRVVRNGVDLERFHPRRRARDRSPVRARLGAGDDPVWLFAGSGFGRKGLDTALRALALGPPEARLWVAGRDDETRWQELAASLGVARRVRFLGFRADLPALYAAADALLLPTRYDAFANVTLEAAASGLPVVTSGRNGAAELFDGEGVVADPRDAEGFAAELSRLADPEVRSRRGASARAVAERHGWDAHVASLRSLFAGLGA